MNNEIITPIDGTVGVKNDTGKAQMHSIPPRVLFYLADLYGKASYELSHEQWEIRSVLSHRAESFPWAVDIEAKPDPGLMKHTDWENRDLGWHLQEAFESNYDRNPNATYLPHYDYMPTAPLIQLARLYDKGGRKYTPDNWRLGMQWSKVFNALMRHAVKFWAGQDYDEVDGQHHMLSVAWSALALIEYRTTHPELDDRIK